MYADWQAVKNKGVIKVQRNLKDLKKKIWLSALRFNSEKYLNKKKEISD